MKKIFSFIFILLVTTIYANNKKKIIVALSLNDCISCSLSLTEINKILKNPEMTIIFRSNLEADSTLVNKKVGLDNYKSSVVIYSDSLYDKYSNGIKSTINILEKNKKIYSADLYKLNIKEFLHIYQTETKKDCFKNVKQGVKYIQDDQSLLVWSYELGRWTYYDENHEFNIISDNNWVKMAYKIYYKGKYPEEKYKEFEKSVKEYPALNPSIDKGIKINADELLFMTTINVTESTDKLDEEIIVQKIFLVTYNIQKQEISSMKYINTESLLKNNYYVNSSDFNKVNDDYIITLVTDNYDFPAKIKYLSLFKVNENNPNELVFEQFINDSMPSNYINYKLNNNFNTYRFDKSLILLIYSEYIYDYKKNVQYKIPFPDSEFKMIENILTEALTTGKVSGYEISDIADKDSSILLLYKDSVKKLKLMKIDKQSQKVISDIVIMTKEELKEIKNQWFTINSKGEIYYLNNENCIDKIKI